MDIFAASVLAMSPLRVWAKSDRMHSLRRCAMDIGCGSSRSETVRLDVRSLRRVRDIAAAPALSAEDTARLSLKYRERVRCGPKTERIRKRKLEPMPVTGDDDDDGFSPQKTKKLRTELTASPLSAPHSEELPEAVALAGDGSMPSLFRECLANNGSLGMPSPAPLAPFGPPSPSEALCPLNAPLPPFHDPFDWATPTLSDHGLPQIHPLPFDSNLTAFAPPSQCEVSAVEELRRQNAFLRRTVAEKQREIEYLSSMITARPTAQPMAHYPPFPEHVAPPHVIGGGHRPLKRIGIGSEAVLPPAA